MGMGHLFRMMNLYMAMWRQGMKAVFVLLGKHAPAESLLQKEGVSFEVVTDSLLEWEAKIIERYHPKIWVNDRLNTDEEHVLRLKSLGLKVITFDDCGNGARYADIHVSALAEARGEKPTGLNVLTGLEYLILPQDIERYRHLRTSANNLVVNFGGSDTYGMTVMAVQWLVQNSRAATVILGPGFMHEEALEEVMGENITVKRSVPSLVAEFSDYDVAITGGGLTAFEAAVAGLPTLTVANELHEIGHCHYLQSLGCSIFAGYREQADFRLLDKITDIQKMSREGMSQLTLSGTENICQLLMQL